MRKSFNIGSIFGGKNDRLPFVCSTSAVTYYSLTREKKSQSLPPQIKIALEAVFRDLQKVK